MIGFEEGLAGGKILDDAAVRLERLADSVAYMIIVVDDKDDLPLIVALFSGVKGWWKIRYGARRWEEALDGLGQLLQPHRLVQLHAIVTRDIAQRACRYVAGQDNDGDATMKLRAQRLDNLEPIKTLRQIVVGKDEIRLDLVSRNEIERGDPVRRRRGMAALVLEQESEKVAHLGVILDDQDGACA